MTFMLRDRPDGQFEIVLSQPILVGIFPDRDIASRVCAFLQAEDIEVTELPAAGFASAAADVAEFEAEAVKLAEEAREESQPRAVVLKPARTPRAQLPTVVPDRPRPPVVIEVGIPARLTDDQISAAFRRVEEGEKLSAVAPDYGLTMYQLRGMWANHRRKMQAHIAEGGQKPCVHCKRPFMPSVSHPDTCARCSHG